MSSVVSRAYANATLAIIWLYFSQKLELSLIKRNSFEWCMCSCVCSCACAVSTRFLQHEDSMKITREGEKGGRREEVTAGKEEWMCGLRCPRSPRGQKLWKWLCRSEKVRQRRGRNKQYKRTGNSEGRKLSVTYWTNKLVCRQNGLRGWTEQKKQEWLMLQCELIHFGWI